MKISKLFLMLFAVGALTTSCKKDYVCECNAFGYTTLAEYSDIDRLEAKDFGEMCEEDDICTWREK